jgi:hypothetical protein
VEYGYSPSVFERELRKEIKNALDEIAVKIVTRSGVSSFEDYHNLTGYVAAYQEALQMMDEVSSRLLKKPE